MLTSRSTRRFRSSPTVEVDDALKWIKKGLNFKCTACGKCCTGKGTVWVSEGEVEKIAKHLKMERQAFEDSYLKETGRDGLYTLKDKEDVLECIFLKEKKCSIYQVRPIQCQTFPWWPELLVRVPDCQKAASVLVLS